MGYVKVIAAGLVVGLVVALIAIFAGWVVLMAPGQAGRGVLPVPSPGPPPLVQIR